jgi:S1-C subfamily serine protease
MADTIYSNSINSVVTILCTVGTSYAIGQGFWIQGPSDGNGYIATAAHVITDSRRTGAPISSNIWIHTTHPTNTIYRINNTTNVVIGRDKLADVALLRIAGAGSIPALAYGNSRTEIAPGSPITVIGYPQGFDPQSVCRGVVRDNKATPDTYFSGVSGRFMESVLTDCSIYGGNSGGPLINDDGKWVGILSWGVGSDGAMNGGVASYLANAMFTWYIANYTVTPLTYPKGYLGISSTPMDMLLAVSRGLTSVQGHLVTASLLTPARFAVGDIILTVNGEPVGILNGMTPFFTAVQLAPPGTTLTITYRPATNLSTILTKTVTTAAFPAARDVIFGNSRALYGSRHIEERSTQSRNSV